MSSHALRLRVGPGPRGEWIVDDETGVCGAIFRDRVEALRFAKAECEASAGSKWQLVPMLDFAAVLAAHYMFTTSAIDFNPYVDV